MCDLQRHKVFLLGGSPLNLILGLRQRIVMQSQDQKFTFREWASLGFGFPSVIAFVLFMFAQALEHNPNLWIAIGLVAYTGCVVKTLVGSKTSAH